MIHILITYLHQPDESQATGPWGQLLILGIVMAALAGLVYIVSQDEDQPHLYLLKRKTKL